MKTNMKAKNNLLKEKYRYQAGGELGGSPINTSEEYGSCECGELTREIADFAQKHDPNKNK
ncbi:hypothetical protein [Desulfofalx alkaliphila]|uniref:hypothetical protein n=1 Tax=Desulfofalx alkaliphila TaxID=105483 RepID=UPI0004E1ED68|nr:hypothetical protein [Desulfofalx alkaliphila]